MAWMEEHSLCCSTISSCSAALFPKDSWVLEHCQLIGTRSLLSCGLVGSTFCWLGSLIVQINVVQIRSARESLRKRRRITLRRFLVLLLLLLFLVLFHIVSGLCAFGSLRLPAILFCRCAFGVTCVIRRDRLGSRRRSFGERTNRSCVHSVFEGFVVDSLPGQPLQCSCRQHMLQEVV